MTDLYEEYWSQRHAIAEGLARGGQILISGLGLGLIVESLLAPENSPVERVTVLEKSPDVIALVAPHLRTRYGDRLRIIETSAFDWQPDTHFTVAWHDIWPNPDAGYADEIRTLHARYAAVSDWQQSWSRETYAAAS